MFLLLKRLSGFLKIKQIKLSVPSYLKDLSSWQENCSNLPNSSEIKYNLFEI